MSRTAADPKDLDDPDKYTVLPEAEVFDEHVRYKVGPDGKPSKEIALKVDKAWLERYAAGSNQRDAEGCPSSMSIGHTIDGAPEKDQPEIVGAFRNWRVAWSPEKKRWVLRCTPYVQKGREAEARSFPNVSIEAWRHMPVIDPVAILRRTPDRPTKWTYEPEGDRWRFSMEDGNVGDPLDPTAPPDAAAPDDEFTQKFSACMQSMYPQMQAMHDKYAAECGGTTPGDPMSTPNPTPTATPTPAPAPAPAPERFSALEQENKGFKDKFAAQEQQIGELQKQLRHRERRADLDRLALRFEMDTAEELADYGDATADKFAAHLKHIEKRYVPKPVDPAAGPAVDTSGPAGVGGADKFSAADAVKAEEYQRKHDVRLKKKYPDAEARAEAAMRWARTGKED